MLEKLDVPIQDAKYEIIEWILNQQSKPIIIDMLAYIRHAKGEKGYFPENYPFHPSTDEELYEKIMKSKNSEVRHSLEEVREMAKSWGRNKSSSSKMLSKKE